MTPDPPTLTRNWSYATPVRFGPGRIAELPAVCSEVGMKKPLLVTDQGLRKLPMIDSALAGLRAAGLGETVFSDIRANPVDRNVDDGLSFYRRNGCDGAIAFGGGSALDVGKAIALMAGQTRPCGTSRTATTGTRGSTLPPWRKRLPYQPLPGPAPKWAARHAGCREHGATAFQNRLGAIHSRSHPVGAHCNTHHGETNGVVMPYVLQLNRDAIEEKMTRLPSYLDLPDVSFQGTLDWVLVLRKDIGIPNTLAELGVKEDDLDTLVPEAVDDPSTSSNSRPVDAIGMREMFVNAIHGRRGQTANYGLATEDLKTAFHRGS